MKYLLFEIEDQTYCIDFSNIIEVIPLVRFNKLHKSEDYIAGLFNYRGTIIPAIDFTFLITNKPFAQLLSTRVIITEISKWDESTQLIGIIAENITDIIDYDENQFQGPGVSIPSAEFLGKVANLQSKIIQQIEVSKILARDVQITLFK